ncbi:shootin-1 isoform X1 [Coturnix japonica]|uniref:shootin-1 isoform X1 n=1 Tax=Coturnix japonica TaxID=93934 RepID=UPI000776F577|nr:shootin-1 isoform X1 [Coturnix japonica]XP_032301417.1 shootin-1 isoform X1 [Coturnix japonica]
MNSSDEEKQLELLAGVKDTAAGEGMASSNVQFNSQSHTDIGEYEELRAENKKAKEECDKIKQERDEAVKKLEEFQKISHMVIEEVNCIQNHLEIEKTCRESAEALASKLNKENKTLKRISMLYMAKLGPEIITEEINIDEDDPSTDTEANSGSCNSVHCQQQIKELRDQIISVHEEKKTLAIELENLRCKLVEVIEEVNKVKEEKAALTTEVNKQQKLLEKCNRVSVLAVEEYEELHVNFELEKNLRKKAESFAQEMFIEQNKMKRQSQLLLQNSAPDQQLLKALDDNAKLTHALEEERLQHQQKVKELEEKLENQALHKEISRLKQQLELLEEDKKELELKCQNSEEKARDLKHTVDELQKRIHQSENPAPPPPPPPPPPLPPPPPPNPIRSLMSMIRKRSHANTNVSKKEKPPQQESGEEVTDLKRQAVEEMMDRIKKGVHLRPVNQSSRPKTKPETPKPSESAMKELKGILETLNKSTSSRSLKSLETDSGETELERVLRRRKVTTDQDSGNPTGILATSESKSLPVLGSEASGVQTASKKKDLETDFSSKAPDSGPVSNQLKDVTGSKVLLQSPSHTELSRKASTSEKETESVVVLDPVSAGGHRMTENALNQNKTKEEKSASLHKESNVEKIRETDSSNC